MATLLTWKTSIWTHFRKRVVRLIIVTFLDFLPEAILGTYEGRLCTPMLLAFDMPMLVVASPALITYFGTVSLILGL